jgi:hypothetical protein
MEAGMFATLRYVEVRSWYRSNTDPVTTPEDKIVVHVLVPLK